MGLITLYIAGIHGEVLNRPLYVLRWITSWGTATTPGVLSFRYILLAKTLDWKNDLWLDRLPNVKLISDTPTLRLYEYQP